MVAITIPNATACGLRAAASQGGRDSRRDGRFQLQHRFAIQYTFVT